MPRSDQPAAEGPMRCERCRREGAQIRECDEEPCAMEEVRKIADAHDAENARLREADGWL